MTPDRITLIIAAGTFIFLLITHYIALKIGWNMGIKSDPSVIMSNPAKEKKTAKSEPIDIFSEEYLDFD